MGTEYRIRRIVDVAVRIIVDLPDNIFRIMTDIIPFQCTEQPAESACICGKLFLIAAHLRHRGAPCKDRLVILSLRTFKSPVHPLDICHSSPYIFHRELHTELIIRLQQDAFCLHQPLTHCPVCGLPEISALRMLLVCSSGHKGDAHVGQHRACEHAPVLFFLQMCQDQSLPVTVQDILTALGRKLHAGSSLSRLQQKMYFRIMTQRFKMSDAFHRACDCLFIYDPALSEFYENSVPVFDQSLQHLSLHLSHELDVYLLRFSCPHDVKLRLLFLKLTKIRQHCMDIASFRQFYSISEHWFEYRDIRVFLFSHSLPRIRSFEPSHCTDHSCLRTLHQLISDSGIDTDLVYFSFYARDQFFYFQFSACHFEISQPVPLRIPGDLIYLCPELFRILRTDTIFPDSVQKLCYSFCFQGRTEPARKYFTLCYGPSQCIFADTACFKILLQHRIVTDGETFQSVRIIFPDCFNICAAFVEPAFKFRH